jgi:hypothetical protein
MALVISAVEVTGTATAYTVPASKVAKVRVVSCSSFDDLKTLTIGNYTAKNDTAATVTSASQGIQSDSNFALGLPVNGFVRFASRGDFMSANFMYVKEDHVLVAGETVSQDDAGATFAYTIFEEDV